MTETTYNLVVHNWSSTSTSDCIPLSYSWNKAKLSVSSTLTQLKGAVSRNSAKLGNYKMPAKLRET